jgi:hypothetical protein
MIGTGSASTFGGAAQTGTFAASGGADLAAFQGTSIAIPRPIRPSIRIAKRRQIPPWKNPRRLDPATIGKFLMLGKCRGLFLRNCVMRFTGTPAKARRTEKLRPKTRPARHWEPVVISPVFPRGPLALPSLGALHDGLHPRRGQRGRRAKRRKIMSYAANQNLSSAACSSP